MAVVAGVVFFTIRALLALFPALTTGFPIKKWSAAMALAAAAFYHLLSGAEVATQRSFFQMSFAAALGLVALIQIGMPRLFASPDHSATARVALWGGRELMTLTLAS